MKEKIYKVGTKIYNVTPDREAEFLKKFPNAVLVNEQEAGTSKKAQGPTPKIGPRLPTRAELIDMESPSEDGSSESAKIKKTVLESIALTPEELEEAKQGAKESVSTLFAVGDDKIRARDIQAVKPDQQEQSFDPFAMAQGLAIDRPDMGVEIAKDLEAKLEASEVKREQLLTAVIEERRLKYNRGLPASERIEKGSPEHDAFKEEWRSRAEGGDEQIQELAIQSETRRLEEEQRLKKLGQKYEDLGGSVFKSETQLAEEDAMEKAAKSIGGRLEVVTGKRNAIATGLKELGVHQQALVDLNKELSSIHNRAKEIQSREYTTQESVDAANSELESLQTEFNEKQAEYIRSGGMSVDDIEREFDSYMQMYGKLEDETIDLLEDEKDIKAYLDAAGRNYGWAINLGMGLLKGVNQLGASIGEFKMMLEESAMHYLGVSDVVSDFVEKIPDFAKPVVAFATSGPINRYAVDALWDLDAELNANMEIPGSFNELETVEDYGEWLGHLVTTQAAQTALTATTGGWALPLLGASSAGATYKELKDEDAANPEFEYSQGQLVTVSLAVGTFEGASELASLGQIKSVKKMLQDPASGINRGFKDYIRRNFFTTRGLYGNVYDPLEEGVSELISQVGSNIANMALAGTNPEKEYINIFDGATDAFSSGTVMSLVFKAPALAKHVLTNVTKQDEMQNLIELSGMLRKARAERQALIEKFEKEGKVNSFQQLSRESQLKDLKDTEIDIIKSFKSTLENAIGRLDYLSKAERTELLKASMRYHRNADRKAKLKKQKKGKGENKDIDARIKLLDKNLNSDNNVIVKTLDKANTLRHADIQLKKSKRRMWFNEVLNRDDRANLEKSRRDLADLSAKLRKEDIYEAKLRRDTKIETSKVAAYNTRKKSLRRAKTAEKLLSKVYGKGVRQVHRVTAANLEELTDVIYRREYDAIQKKLEANSAEALRIMEGKTDLSDDARFERLNELEAESADLRAERNGLSTIPKELLNYQPGSNSWGMFLPHSGDIVLNLDAPPKSHKYSAGEHEIMHALLHNTMKDNPEAAYALGQMMDEYIARYGVKLRQRSIKEGKIASYKERIKLYENYYGVEGERVTWEEKVTLFMDAISDKEITPGVVGYDIVKNTFNNILASVGLKRGMLKLSKPEDLVSFLTTYHRTHNSLFAGGHGVVKRVAQHGFEINPEYLAKASELKTIRKAKMQRELLEQQRVLKRAMIVKLNNPDSNPDYSLEDIVDMLTRVNEGELIREGKYANLTGNITGTKSSRSYASRDASGKDVTDEINAFASMGWDNASWKETGYMFAMNTIISERMLDGLIASKLKVPMSPVETDLFIKKVYAELTSHVRNFKPEENDSLFGWINSQIANKAGNVFNKEYKDQIENRAVDIDQRREDGSEIIQIADPDANAETVIDRIDFNDREAVERHSKLRKDLGISEYAKDRIQKAVEKVFTYERLPNVSTPDVRGKAQSFRDALQKAFYNEIRLQIQNRMGKREDFDEWLYEHGQAVYEALPLKTLIDFERQVKPEKGEKRIFTQVLVENANATQVDHYIAQGNLKFDTPRTSGPTVYAKAPWPGNDAFFAFFRGSNRSKGIDSMELLGYKKGGSTLGTRKDALAGAIAVELGFDATMEILSRPEMAARRTEIVELLGYPLEENTLPLIGRAINRDPRMKFSMDFHENESSDNVIDVLLGQYGHSEIYDFSDPSGTNTFVQDIIQKMAKLMPKEFFIRPDGSTIFDKNADVKDKAHYGTQVGMLAKLPDSMFGKPVPGVEDFSLAKRNELLADPANNIEAIKEMNDRMARISKTFWTRVNTAIQADPNAAKVIGTYLKMVAVDPDHWHWNAAQFAGYSKNPTGKLKPNFATTPLSSAAALFDSAMSGVMFEKTYEQIMDNYKVIALDESDRAKLPYKGMPGAWTIMANRWWQKYFNDEVVENSDGGIDPNGIVTPEGETFAREYDINAEGHGKIIPPKRKKKKKVKAAQPKKRTIIKKDESPKEISKKRKEKEDAIAAEENKPGPLSDEFNRMLERKTGIPADVTYEYQVAKARGKKKKAHMRFFIPPSAEDFKGLLYYFLGKGKRGERDLEFFKDKLITPFADALEKLDTLRLVMSKNWRLLKKDKPDVIRRLKDEVGATGFTIDNAIRVWLWTKNEIKIPGISELEIELLNDTVREDERLIMFAAQIEELVDLEDGYVKPSDYWVIHTIERDLEEASGRQARKEYLKEWTANKNEIFSKENLNKIEAIHGHHFRDALEGVLWRMEHGTNRRQGADAETGRLLNWINNSTGAIMFFNTRSAVLQTLSTVNFINWSDNNIFAAAKAFANQKQYWTDVFKIMNSDLLVQRRAGLRIDASINEVMDRYSRSGGKLDSIIHYLLELGFKPTQVMDSLAISLGGATFYRNRYNKLIKDGLSKEDAEAKAWTDFREIAQETQQSAREDLISEQQAGMLGRILLAFQNTPMQYNRLVKKAILDLANNRGNKIEHASKIIYYLAIQNLMFNALQSGLAFEWMFGDGGEDEKEEGYGIDERELRTINGMIDSVLRGLGYYGVGMAAIKNSIKAWVQRDEKKMPGDEIIRELVNASPNIGSKLRKIANADKNDYFNRELYNEMDWSFNNPFWETTGNLVEAVTNVPLGRVVTKARHLELAMQDELATWQRIALALGWNKWDLGIEDKELQEAKEIIKERKKEARKIKREAEKEEKKIEREKQKAEEIQKKKDEGYVMQNCAHVKKNGDRCGNTNWVKKGKSWKCDHHKNWKGKRDIDKDGIIEHRCKATTTKGKACGNYTENKSGLCYAHEKK